jgi:hypothetical protein
VYLTALVPNMKNSVHHFCLQNEYSTDSFVIVLSTSFLIINSNIYRLHAFRYVLGTRLSLIDTKWGRHIIILGTAVLWLIYSTFENVAKFQYFEMAVTVNDSCEYDNRPSVSIRCWAILEWQSNY